MGQTWTHLPQLVQVAESPQGGIEIGHDTAVAAPIFKIPGVRPLDLTTHPDTSSAEHTTVMIEDKPTVGSIHLQFRVATRKGDMINPELLRQLLELTVTVGHADRADMVALGKEQLNDTATIPVQPLRLGGDHQPLLNPGDAGGGELGTAFDLNHAQSAGANRRESLQEAKGGDSDVVFPGRSGGWFHQPVR